MANLFLYDTARPITWYDQFLEAQTFSDTQINLYWDDTSSDSYTLQASTDNSTWSTIYTGSNLSYNHTGLSVGSLHYYRLKGSKLRSADSNYATANATTLSFTPLAVYNLDGIHSLVPLNTDTNNDNAYGTWQNQGTTSFGNVTKGITVIKPFMGYGPIWNYQNTLEPIPTAGRTLDGAFQAISLPGQSTWGYLNSDSNISLTGDFTIALPDVILQTNAFVDFICDATGTKKRISFGNVNFLTVSIAGTDYTLLYPNRPLVIGNWYKFFIQRSGTQLRVGIYSAGTMTWGSNVTAVSSTLNLNRLFNSATPSNNTGFQYCKGSMFFIASVLSDNQCIEAAQYFLMPNYSSSSALSGAITIPGAQNFTSIASNGYITDPNLSSYFGTTKRQSRVLTIGDKTFLGANRLPAAPLYSQDSVRVFDHTTGKISDAIFFPIETSSTDVHLNSGYGIYDNKLHRITIYPFYDVGICNRILIDRSGPNFNFNSFTRITQLKKSRNKLGFFAGEPNFNPVLNSIYILNQEFGSVVSAATRLRILKSTDNLNSFEGNVLVETSDGTRWPYPLMAISGTSGVIYVAVSIYKFNNSASDQYINACIIKSIDGYTWTNVAGSFSKDIRNGNYLTLSDLTTNCSIISTATSNAQTVIRGLWVDPNGEVFGIVGDGAANNQTTGVGGTKFFYTSSGTTTLNQVSIPSHSNLISPQFHDGGFIKKDVTDLTGNTFDFYCAEYLGTANCWSLIKSRTTDKGATWTYVSKLSTDDTKRHDLIRGSDNYLYSGGKCLLTSVKNDGVYPPTTNGTWFIKDISN